MLPPPEPTELPDDVLGDILLRLPPDDPASLLRASLVCKRWRRVLADPAFRRDRGVLHRRPSFLGLLHVVSKELPFCSRFVPNDPACRRPAARDLPGWLVLDCRHGRALFATARENLGTLVTLDFIVWDPLTGGERRLPRLSSWPTPTVGTLGLCWNAAVLCAATAEGCDHRGCLGGPFIVVLLCIPSSFKLSARVYSSETGKWSEPTSSVCPPNIIFVGSGSSTALVGDTLYFRICRNRAVKYQLGTQLLSVINEPPALVFQGFSIHPMTTEDGGLRFTGLVEGLKSSVCLCLCSMEEGQGGVARWARLGAIELEMLLPDGALSDNPYVYVRCSDYADDDADDDAYISAQVVGFVDGTDVCFVGVRKRYSDTDAVYMVELNSGRSRKVLEDYSYVFPYTSFCIPVIEVNSTREGRSNMDKLKMLMQRLLNFRIFRSCCADIQMVDQ